MMFVRTMPFPPTEMTVFFLPLLDAILGRCAALLEAIGLVAGLDDVAMVRQPVQQCRSQLGIAEYATPLREG